MTEQVDHPEHYGGPNNPHEVIECLEAWRLTANAYRFNAIKYLSRAGKKGDLATDLRKAIWYVERELAALAANPQAAPGSIGVSRGVVDAPPARLALSDEEWGSLGIEPDAPAPAERGPFGVIRSDDSQGLPQ